MRQFFDDGSYLDLDQSLNVTGGADAFGGAITPAVRNIGQQVLDLVSFGVRSAIYANYGAAAQQAAAPAPAAAGSQLNQLMPILLLAGGAFVAYKLIAD